MTDRIYQPETLPVLALRNLVIFPGQTISFEVGRLKSIRAIKSALDTEERKIFLVSQQDALIEDPKFTDLSKVGVVARVQQISGSTESNSFEIVVEGLYRAVVTEPGREKISLRATVQRVTEIRPDDSDFLTVATLRTLKNNLFSFCVQVSFRRFQQVFSQLLQC